jgi:hypothetical protein
MLVESQNQRLFCLGDQLEPDRECFLYGIRAWRQGPRGIDVKLDAGEPAHHCRPKNGTSIRMDGVEAYQPSDFFSSHVTSIRSSVEQHDLYTLTLVVPFDIFRNDDESVCFSHRAEYARFRCPDRFDAFVTDSYSRIRS